ncbi:hypothetical protein ABW20_dc0107808 [Dactylellina cionopaga]|nr:hypothetical protein ABW20_dc0107808 [Dactylellina cionopaga]
MRFVTLLPLLALLTGTALAADPPQKLPPVDKDGKLPDGRILVDFKAKVSLTFPDNESPLGITIVNGRVARLNLEVTNNELKPITVEGVGGLLRKNDRTDILRNLTTSRTLQVIPVGGVMNIPYSFVPNMHAQDVVLELVVMFSPKDQGNKPVQYTAYNGTISVAEAPTSLLDPQILFLYLFILGVVGAGGYVAYQTWVVPMLPKPKRVRPVAVPTEAKTTSAEVPKGQFDESWIPEHHLKRPVAQKVRSSGTPKPKAK